MIKKTEGDVDAEFLTSGSYGQLSASSDKSTGTKKLFTNHESYPIRLRWSLMGGAQSKSRSSVHWNNDTNPSFLGHKVYFRPGKLWPPN